MSRISEPPLWFDEHAVPRYDPFTPDGAANIYANCVALARITCQGCGIDFRVCFSESQMDKINYMIGESEYPYVSLEERVRTQTLHYGDPPNTGCCAGTTMNSEPREVLEFWKRERFEWVRDPSLEVKVIPEWVSEDD